MTATPITDLTAPLNASPLERLPARPLPHAPAGRSSRPSATRSPGSPGLTVFASSTQVNASGMQVVRALAGHQFAAGLQYALTEGVTALFLITVIWGVTGTAQSGRARRAMRLAALVATVVSLAECGLGLWLSAASPVRARPAWPEPSTTRSPGSTG